jgi:hypothetical protein
MPPAKAASWIGPVLTELERYYWTAGGPAEKTKEDMVAWAQGPWRPALAIFYGHYAYERAGAPRSWGPLARNLIEALPAELGVGQIEQLLWDQFTAQVKKPNPKLNPLATAQPKIPTTRFVVALVEDEHNLIRWATRQMRSGHAMNTSRRLQELQGIGPKIAAFFLRDLVTSHGIDEGSLDDRRAIFPIDVWVRRGVAALAGKEILVEDERVDRQIQDLALRMADDMGVRLATLDAGLWVLGARFARSPARMSEALKSPSNFRRMVEAEVKRAEAEAKALRTVLTDVARSQPEAREARPSAARATT